MIRNTAAAASRAAVLDTTPIAVSFRPSDRSRRAVLIAAHIAFVLDELGKTEQL